ncbi:MAG: metalloprotease, partial [Winogradskyella sp.]|nr:metalloprotease [Winogradskyella sp.]
VYLNDWNNSYSTKSTPLAKRFEEEFSTKFHLAKNSQRGFTTVTSIRDDSNQTLTYTNPKDHPDVLEVDLNNPVLPKSSYTLILNYILVIPDNSFTSYGFTNNKDFELKHWYITPAVYDGKWHYYSNKDLDDLYVPKADITLTLTHPRNYQVVSELDFVSIDSNQKAQTTILYGKDRIDTYLLLSKLPNYGFVQTDDFILVSNIGEKGLPPQDKAILTDKITAFLTEHLGPYPHKKLVVSQVEYSKSPLYGLNQLPDFLRPFPDSFQYELKLLKTALNKYIDNLILVNPRKDYWLNDGLQIYLMIKYVEDNYPDMKLLGTLANVWGLRAFHAADVNFNFQYYLYFMEMARKNRDQPLTTSKDSLIKFNESIAGKYKAGLGLTYLNEFTQDTNLLQTIKEFIEINQLKTVSTADFEVFLKSKTNKNLDWFFEDYIDTRKKLDFKIKRIEETNDSLLVTIKNKRDNKMPVQLFALNEDSIKQKLWVENIKKTKTVAIAKDTITKFVLDYDNILPEFNQRDNWKSPNGFLFNNKPFQFRLFKDIEDPNYNQVFLMPLVEFNNIYDGLTLGTKVYNKTILRKRLNYKFSPQYATNSQTLTGSASVFYTHNIENRDLFNITYGMAYAYRSFAQDAFFTLARPSLVFSFRNDSDLRSDETKGIVLQYVGISRDVGADAIIDQLDEPDYGVLNLRYVSSNPGIINFSRFSTDLQIANNFSKVSVNYEYRKLSKNNRNFNFRFFAGAFLKNNTDPTSNYFSFALDRPTDYLFELNYLGRSEDSGIFSQQIIIAEGGFKSQLDNPFANQWMTTTNFVTSIWRYVQAYADFGLYKNRNLNPRFVYDSGIRLNLVEDYFELFFPVYSSLGWEVGQPNYDQRIRIKFTLDPQVLLGLFRRKWY